MKNKNQLIKKLLYQSNYRGCKETDLIIGTFAKKHINSMSIQELLEFEKILSYADNDLYNWYIGKKTVPIEKKSDLLFRILNFKI